MNESTQRAEARREDYVEAYAPLVRAAARRYQGRGADYEDLVQEGFLALLILLPKCPDMKWLAAFLKNNLPGYVRAAAARMRAPRVRAEEVLLEEIEETVSESESQRRYRESELRTMLESQLTAEELDLTQALLEGFTQKELAEILGITQQAVAARLRKIRRKLASVLAELHAG